MLNCAVTLVQNPEKELTEDNIVYRSLKYIGLSGEFVKLLQKSVDAKQPQASGLLRRVIGAQT